MKKHIPLFLITLLLIGTVDCYGDAYAKVFGGANFLQNTATDGNHATYQTGGIIAGSLGYCCRCSLRVEGEYAYRRNDIKKIHFFGNGSSREGHFESSSYMANILRDFTLYSREWVCWNLRPFLGGGVGYNFQQLNASNSRIVFHQKWNNFAWQLMAGFTYPVYCDTEISLEYKFHQGGHHFYNHSVGVGFSYRFGFFKQSS